MVSPSVRAATSASSRATRVPETNSRSTNSRLRAGTTVTAGGSTTRDSAASAGAGQAADLPGAILAMSAGGKAQGAMALAVQTPASAAATATTTRIKARRIIGPRPRRDRVGRQRAGKQRLHDGDRHLRLRAGIEVGLDCNSLEDAADESEEEPRAEPRIELRGSRARRLRRIHEPLEAVDDVGVDRLGDRRHARIAARFSPDLDDEPRLLRRFADHMFAQARPHRLRDVAVASQ